MGRAKCKECQEVDFDTEFIGGYCKKCYDIKEKILKGLICPDCHIEYKEDDKFCLACGLLKKEYHQTCFKCKKEIVHMSDMNFIFKEIEVQKFREDPSKTFPEKVKHPICKECYEKETKEPPPETMEQKFDRFIDVWTEIAESIKIIADSYKK